MSTAAESAIRRDIAKTKRYLVRLERALEIVSGKRGITGAPAEADVEREETVEHVEVAEREEELADEEPSSPRRSNGRRASGELPRLIRELMKDGQPRTVQEIGGAIGGTDYTRFYEPVRKMDDLILVDHDGGPRGTAGRYRLKVRESVITPGGGVRDGRIKA